MDSITAHSRHHEITLAELFSEVWRDKWMVLGFALVAALAAGVTAFVLPKQYKASIVISPVTEDARGQLGGLTSLMSELGGIASLAGISSSGDSKRAESLTVLQSEALTESYIQQNDLLPVLFAKKWNAQAKAWKESDPTERPTLWKGNEYFKKHVRAVTTDTKSGIVTLSITWKDPNTAAKWANELVAMTNDYLRRKAIDVSQRNIQYLNAQATRTDVVPVKQAIYTILQSEINKEMLARGNEEYAFKILDPARPPEKPSSPLPVLWISAALFGSLLLSLLIAFLRIAWNKRES